MSTRASRAPEPGPQGPVRTCVGCKERQSRSVLVRVVAQGGLAVVDASASQPGRGAWMHPTPECLTKALERRAFSRALRVEGLDVSGISLDGAGSSAS